LGPRNLFGAKAGGDDSLIGFLLVRSQRAGVVNQQMK
jgi:hypothetical protein